MGGAAGMKTPVCHVWGAGRTPGPRPRRGVRRVCRGRPETGHSHRPTADLISKGGPQPTSSLGIKLVGHRSASAGEPARKGTLGVGGTPSPVVGSRSGAGTPGGGCRDPSGRRPGHSSPSWGPDGRGTRGRSHPLLGVMRPASAVPIVARVSVRSAPSASQEKLPGRTTSPACRAWTLRSPGTNRP